jgi:CRISPR-associated endonuclease/helicase Cas3
MITSFLEYPDFFEQVTKFQPYPCQVVYAKADSDFVALRLPTGIGKTLAVLVSWLYRQQHGKAPTRLVIIEPMRVLVQQVIEEAQRTVQNSGLNISVHLLMGGAIDNEWITQPEKPCVIVGTQDQILSRQLNRGYACSRWSWPQHFALLNNDCELFIDECQLMGPGYSTTVELSHWRKELGVAGDCRVIWSSATLDVSPLKSRNIQATEINLSYGDYNHPDLSRKISRTKAIYRLKVTLKSYAQNLAEYVAKKHHLGTMSLIIVNQVSRAIAVFEALQKLRIPIRLLHSRFRGEEREKLLHGLKNFKGIIVSTQVVEAGVDLDARNLFTEVADWASLVQRFGRCGRNNTYPDAADIYWIDCQGWSDGELLPYLSEDCRWSQQTLETLDNASIENLLQIESPPQRVSGQTLTKDNLIKLFDNHPTADERDMDVSGMIRSRGVPAIQVAWVDRPPASDWSPSEKELCPVSINKLTRLIGKVYVWNDFSEEWSLGIPNSGSPAILLREWGGYSDSLGFTGKSSHIPAKSFLDPQDSQKTGWDRPSYLSATQAQHGSGQAHEMARIRKCLSHIDLPDWLYQFAFYCVILR